jgi:hypothetical protein
VEGTKPVTQLLQNPIAVHPSLQLSMGQNSMQVLLRTLKPSLH